jgi:PAS domain-containing protein
MSVTGSLWVGALLETAGGLMAVLNEQRQVLAVNHALLRMLRVEDPGGLVGLRPGEAVGCDHAADPPSGCGTTRYCSSCGAALSIVGALSTESDLERKCVLTLAREGGATDLCLKVRARVILVDERRFVLLFLQDVTTQERLAEVQRVFFHLGNGRPLSPQNRQRGHRLHL